MKNRRVHGVQIHHSADVAHAYAGAHKACTGLEIAIVKCADPRLVDLRDQAVALIRAIGAYERTARLRAEQLKAGDPDWPLYVDGDLPYPDERSEGLIPRCRCWDRCLWHDVLGRDGAPPARTACNCVVRCYQHRRIRRGPPQERVYEPQGRPDHED